MRAKPYLILVAFAMLVSCKNVPKEVDKQVIAVSILPQKFFVEKISGNALDVQVMIPPGASPATFDPSPKDLTKIAGASAYFRIGHIEFEKGWDNKMKSVNKNAKFYDLSENIELIASDDHGHHHAGVDPHTWMSVKNARIISENILNAFLELYPDQADIFKENFRNFSHELDTLDHWIENQLKVRDKEVFLIFHPALTYYARDYGLEQESLEFEGKQPSPAHFKKITKIAEQHNIQHVFIQKQFDVENALMLANQIQAEIVEIDPLDMNWDDQMISITNKLKTALN